MPSLTIKGVPENLLEELRRRAADHRRSLNSEVLLRLERSLGSSPVDPEALLGRVKRLHERNPSLAPLTEERLRKAKAEGRP